MRRCWNLKAGHRLMNTNARGMHDDQGRDQICRNSRATALVDKALTSDPNVYPPAEVRARLFFDKPVTPQYERLRTRAWTRIKTGR